MAGAHGLRERRPYSIACSPERAEETGQLELLVAMDQDGSLGPHFGQTPRDTWVDIDGPIGTFRLPVGAADARVLLVAGGTGIAPLRAMLDHLLRLKTAPRVSLLYSARRAEEFAFINELRTHSAAGLLELHQTVTREDSPTWTGARGRIGRAHFEALLHDPPATLCAVCGPENLVKESAAMLTALGVPPSHIVTESWGT